LSFSINSTSVYTNTTGEFSGLAPGNYTIRARDNISGCVSGEVALVVNAVAGAPDAAVIEIMEYATPASATGVIRVKNANTGMHYGAGYEYKNDGYDVTSWDTVSFFTYTAGMGYNIKVRKTSDNTCVTSISCPSQTSNRQAQPVVHLPVNVSKATGQNKDIVAFPVPFSDKVTIEFRSEKNENYVVNLYDMQGRLVKQLKAGNAKAGELTRLELSGKGMPDSMYLVRKVSKSGVETVKLLKKE
jgi:hypothetical protein